VAPVGYASVTDTAKRGCRPAVILPGRGGVFSVLGFRFNAGMRRLLSHERHAAEHFNFETN
jgi:hypothetical protein